MSYQTPSNGTALHPGSADIDPVSPQSTGASPPIGSISPQITGITSSSSPASPPAAHPAAPPPLQTRETVESMNSGIEVVSDHPSGTIYSDEKHALAAQDHQMNGNVNPQQQQYGYSEHPQAVPGQEQYAASKGMPQEQPQQQQPPKNQYHVATPLGSLQQGPTPVDCPVCGVRELTRTEFVSGGTTHLSAALCCLCFCLGCVPYLASWFKDCEHHCGRCGALLAVWHRSGRTEVLAHGGVPAPAPK